MYSWINRWLEHVFKFSQGQPIDSDLIEKRLFALIQEKLAGTTGWKMVLEITVKADETFSESAYTKEDSPGRQ